MPFTEFAANEQILANERATVLKQAARLAYFEFTEKEICALLKRLDQLERDNLAELAPTSQPLMRKQLSR